MTAARSAAPSRWSAIAAVLAGAAVLCAVAAICGGPLLYPDSRAYYIGGAIGVDRALGLLAGLFAEARPNAAGAVEDAVRGAIGVRSPFYSLFVYLFGIFRTLWPVVIVQAVLTSCVVWIFVRVAAGRVRIPVFLGLMVGLAALTGASWYAGFVMPDIFAPLVILAVTMLAFYRDRLGLDDTLALVAILAAGVAFHMSHLLIALAAAGIAWLIALYDRQSARHLTATAVILVAPIVLAIGAMLTVSVVAFHQVTLSPQAPPFLLARSLADGPVRRYLLEHCPDLDTVMCQYADNLPEDTTAFLWADESIFRTATPELRDRIRAEQMPLVLAAAREYPLDQLGRSLTNWLSQLVTFHLQSFNYSLLARAEITADDFVIEVREGSHRTLLWIFSAVHYVTVAASLVLIAGGLGALHGPDGARLRRALIVIGCALVVNAAVCGILSGSSPRYQARVIWLLPLLAGVTVPRAGLVGRIGSALGYLVLGSVN